MLRHLCGTGPSPTRPVDGRDVRKRILGWWDGIDLRLGTAVKQVVPGGVELADGTVLDADLVVTGSASGRPWNGTPTAGWNSTAAS